MGKNNSKKREKTEVATLKSVMAKVENTLKEKEERRKALKGKNGKKNGE